MNDFWIFLENRKDYLEDSEFKKLKELLLKLEEEDKRRKEESDSKKEEGNLMYKNGMLEEAISFYSEALVIDKNNTAARSNRAMVYQKLGKIDLAIQDCLDGIEIDKKFIKFYIRLAALFEKTDFEKSKFYVLKGLEIEPENQALLDFSEKYKISKDYKNDCMNDGTYDGTNDSIPSSMPPIENFQQLFKNKEMQNYVKDFVKGKSPSELAEMMKDVLGKMNTK